MGHGKVMDDEEGVLKGECRPKSKRRAAEYQPLPCKWNHRRFKWDWKTSAWAAL